MDDLNRGPQRYDSDRAGPSIKCVTLQVFVATLILLSGCGAYVTDLATVNETASVTPSPLKPESSNHTGFSQSNNEINTPTPLESKTPRDDINVSIVENNLAKELNNYRADEDLNVLIRDSRLATIARHHSYDMAKREFFDHENPSGQNFSNRLANHGYRCNPGAENIHWTGWKVENRTTEEELAYESMLSFMQSAPHNAKMLVPEFTTVGIGIYVTEDRHVFVTMLLCK